MHFFIVPQMIQKNVLIVACDAMQKKKNWRIGTPRLKRGVVWVLGKAVGRRTHFIACSDMQNKEY
jgi:hypothetical protein